MLSAVINLVNQIGLVEGQTYLLKCYDNKGNYVGDGDIKISGVDEAPEITGANKDSDEQD